MIEKQCVHMPPEVAQEIREEFSRADLFDGKVIKTANELNRVKSDLEDANNLIDSVRKVLASTIPEHAVKEALIQLRQYKKEKSV